MKNLKKFNLLFVLSFFIISCGQQTAPSVMQNDLSEISSNNDNLNDRLAMDQNDSEINFEESGPSIDLTVPQPELIREAPPKESLNLTNLLSAELKAVSLSSESVSLASLLMSVAVEIRFLKLEVCLIISA